VIGGEKEVAVTIRVKADTSDVEKKAKKVKETVQNWTVEIESFSKSVSKWGAGVAGSFAQAGKDLAWFSAGLGQIKQGFGMAVGALDAVTAAAKRSAAAQRLGAEAMESLRNARHDPRLRTRHDGAKGVW
jgi:hypothetical protein